MPSIYSCMSSFWLGSRQPEPPVPPFKPRHAVRAGPHFIDMLSALVRYKPVNVSRQILVHAPFFAASAFNGAVADVTSTKFESLQFEASGPEYHGTTLYW